MKTTVELLDRMAATFGADPSPEQDATGNAILDATLDQISANGPASLTLEAVAQRAGCNRITVYRRFSSREGLLVALASREAQRMRDELQRSIEGLADPTELICEGFEVAARLAVSHPLVDRALRHEPDALVGALTMHGSRVLRIGGAAVAAALRVAQASGIARHVDPDAAGLVAARLLASFLLLPGPDIDIHDPADVRRYAHEVLAPLLLGPPVQP